MRWHFNTVLSISVGGQQRRMFAYYCKLPRTEAKPQLAPLHSMGQRNAAACLLPVIMRQARKQFSANILSLQRRGGINTQFRGINAEIPIQHFRKDRRLQRSTRKCRPLCIASSRLVPSSLLIPPCLSIKFSYPPAMCDLYNSATATVEVMR
jgi:hypothetical protein